MTITRNSNVRSVRVREVIEVVALEGHGIGGDPVREVTYYYTPDGEVLARNDPHFSSGCWHEEPAAGFPGCTE